LYEGGYWALYGIRNGLHHVKIEASSVLKILVHAYRCVRCVANNPREAILCISGWTRMNYRASRDLCLLYLPSSQQNSTRAVMGDNSSMVMYYESPPFGV
jgi:hypothetical protein